VGELTDAQRPFFAPKDGEKSQAERVYDLLRGLQPGDVLEYKQVIEVEDLDLQGDRSPIYGAQKLLEKNDRRTVEAVPNVGYRVVEADEHARLASNHTRKAKRQYGKAKRRVTFVREDELTSDAARAELAELRARVGSLEQHARWSSKKLGQADEAIKGLKSRTKRVETASERLQRKVASMESEMRQLKRQLDQ
jgi:hypothetical protein